MKTIKVPSFELTHDEGYDWTHYSSSFVNDVVNEFKRYARNSSNIIEFEEFRDEAMLNYIFPSLFENIKNKATEKNGFYRDIIEERLILGDYDEAEYSDCTEVCSIDQASQNVLRSVISRIAEEEMEEEKYEFDILCRQILDTFKFSAIEGHGSSVIMDAQVYVFNPVSLEGGSRNSDWKGIIFDSSDGDYHYVTPMGKFGFGYLSARRQLSSSGYNPDDYKIYSNADESITCALNVIDKVTMVEL